MFERDIYNQLQKWAERTGRKPLVLRGARQVGKTTLVNEFARNFENYLHLNLEREEDARLFQSTDKVQEIMKIACFQKNILLREGRTLLFIDEIQNVPKAVALLRYFYEDMPDLYVIAAGSRLQSLLKERISFPVGRVEYMQLSPCTFGEYLTAMGEGHYRTAIDEISLPSALHEEAMSRFHRYTLIGGMPEVVADYAENGDLVRLKSIYNSLLKGYNEDVEKYAPTQLQTYNSKEVREAFNILEKAFILHLVYPVTAMHAPALPALKRAPKLMWLDTGLVNFAANIQTEVLHDRTLMDTWQGAIAEHIVAQQLQVLLDEQYISDLHFWVRDKQGSNAETDFVWQKGTQIIPIEVKCGKNAHLRSLHSFMDLSGGDLAVRIWSGPYSIDDVKTVAGKSFRLINLPFYYLGSLPKILSSI